MIVCWAAKGGVGTTVVAAGLALAAARVRGVLLVDLAGDLPGILGLSEPGGPGVSEWTAASAGLAPDALARLEVAAAPGLALLPLGGVVPEPNRAEDLGVLLAEDRRLVVVDAGRIGLEAGPSLGQVLAGRAERSFVVARPCAVGLRRLAPPPARATGLIVVREAGRAIGSADVARIAGVPVVAELAVDPAVARAVDAGLLASRLPRRLLGALAAVT